MGRVIYREYASAHSSENAASTSSSHGAIWMSACTARFSACIRGVTYSVYVPVCPENSTSAVMVACSDM